MAQSDTQYIFWHDSPLHAAISPFTYACAHTVCLESSFTVTHNTATAKNLS